MDKLLPLSLRSWRCSYFAAVVSLCLSPAVFADPCGEDGFCTIISVQSENEQRTPRTPGVVVGVIGDDGFTPSPGATFTAKQVCRKVVRVPKAVHDVVNRMFSSLNDRGGPSALPAALTPAEQTMLLYYNTIMQQTLNFQCS
jgi:hypothetical protein